MQKWEYKYIGFWRGWVKDRFLAAYSVSTDWTGHMDGREYKQAEIDGLIAKLGEDGWELVAISPRSGVLGGSDLSGSSDYAGFTNEELWVFKRPKS